MNCSIMPRSVGVVRLAQLDPLAGLPSFQPATAHSAAAPAQKRPATPGQARVPAKRRKAAARDELSSGPLGSRHGADERAPHVNPTCWCGAISCSFPNSGVTAAASSSQFQGSHDGPASLMLAGSSHSSDRTSWQGREDSSDAAIIRAALARLHFGTPNQGHALSAFHRQNPPSTKVTVPHSPDFLKELHCQGRVNAPWLSRRTQSLWGSYACLQLRLRLRP